MRHRAFTIIELLVVVSIIALLIGILLPAIGKARDQAKLSQSQGNLRNLAAANQAYAADWNDRQFTLVHDTIASYGTSIVGAVAAFNEQVGEHPPVSLGWASGQGGHDSGGNRLWGYWMDTAGNAVLLPPIGLQTQNEFGSFRMCNVAQFRQYVGARFYDSVFYPPKDTMVLDAISRCDQSPDEWCTEVYFGDGGGYVGWSSYVFSPAAMYSPDVMAAPREDGSGGFTLPFDMPGSFRSPGFSQALYPDLKTHMLEHHWLQQRRAECNPSFAGGSYGGCEPYYFNHAWESVPVTLFYDGHIEGLGVCEAEKADSRVLAQTNDLYGLWSRDTTFGEEGYLIEFGYDFAETSFHVLTTSGIRGRDKTGDG